MSTIPLPLTVLITGLISSRSHANCNDVIHIHVCRYQPIPALMSQINRLHREYTLVSKQLDRLKRKIAKASESTGVTLDEQTHDFKNITTSSDSSVFFENLPKDSFQYIFWRQQVEAANKKVAKSMRWHPLMIRWCVYLRHR